MKPTMTNVVHQNVVMLKFTKKWHQQTLWPYHLKFRSFYLRIFNSKVETPYGSMSKSTSMSMSLACILISTKNFKLKMLLKKLFTNGINGNGT